MENRTEEIKMEKRITKLENGKSADNDQIKVKSLKFLVEDHCNTCLN